MKGRTQRLATVPLSLAGPSSRCGFARRLGRMALAAAALVALAAPALLPVQAQAQMRSYAIDAHESSVQVLVLRKGLFSLLAHDHVLVADGFAGRVGLDPQDVTHSSLQMTFPVASLQVDPPEARRERQLDGELNESDRADIRDNMLAADQLDNAEHPRIVATLESVSGTLPDLVLALRVRIKGVEKLLSVPARVEIAANTLRASGEFSLTQSDFGIDPYSALLGSIAVQDAVQVRFRIVARAEAS